MNKWRLFHLKNEMLAANFLANFIGAVLVQALIVKAELSRTAFLIIASSISLIWPLHRWYLYLLRPQH